MKFVLYEWFIDAPWGKIALISWGNPTGEPVLLVHGRQDSAATFIPLLEYLPTTFYYVGIDLPGHGKSDPFPTGLILMRFHFVAAVDFVIQHLKWTKFIYLAHSMGSEIGLYYKAVYPNHLKKLILIDPTPAFRLILSQTNDTFEEYFKIIDDYYCNFESYNNNDRVYSKDEALRAVMRARQLNERQADLILSRNLKSIGNNKFKLSWDRRLKSLAPFNCPVEYYYQLFTKNIIPTLVIVANNSKFPLKGKKEAEKILSDMINEHVAIQQVEGGHDVHFTNPELISDSICKVLTSDSIRAKL